MTTETRADAPTAELESPAGAAADTCAQCGTPLADDQEWCLECGAARTLVHRPPDWRIGAAIVASVALIALIALAVVLINISHDANTSASAAAARPPAGAAAASAAPAAPTASVAVPTTPAATAAAPTATAASTAASGAPTTTAATAATTPTTATTASLDGLPGWAAGLDGWTVVLASLGSESAAINLAHDLIARGLNVGVLDSSEHPAMRPGRWIVYYGRYPTRADARTDAIGLRDRGFDSARPAIVGRTGG